MSWSPDLYIGELRPWPDSVHVVRGNTDETRRYFPERKDRQEALERRIDELCAEVEQLKAENAKLRELVRMMWKSYCWANSGYETYLTDEQDVRVRDLVRELGIEVTP